MYFSINFFIRGVSSGIILFAYRNFNEKWNKKFKKITPDSPKIENGPIQMIWMGKSSRHIWVNYVQNF